MGKFEVSFNPARLSNDIEKNYCILPLTKIMNIKFKGNGKQIDPDQDMLIQDIGQAIVILASNPDEVDEHTKVYSVTTHVIKNYAPDSIELAVGVQEFTNILSKDITSEPITHVLLDHKYDEAYINFTTKVIYIVNNQELDNEYKVLYDLKHIGIIDTENSKIPVGIWNPKGERDRLPDDPAHDWKDVLKNLDIYIIPEPPLDEGIEQDPEDIPLPEQQPWEGRKKRSLWVKIREFLRRILKFLGIK